MTTLDYPEKLLIPNDTVHSVTELLEEEMLQITQLLCLPVQGLLLLGSEGAVDRELSKLIIPSRGPL